MKMNGKASTIAAVAVGIVAVIAGMLLSRALLERATSDEAVALVTGTLLDPPGPLPEFELTDHHERRFDNERLRGQWTFVFFGFTYCPDVCPTTLQMLAGVVKSLADLPEPQRPHVVLVSVDPQRDTPAQLARYVAHFNPDFVGVTGEQDAIDKFTRQIGVPVAITQLGDGNYTVDHSAAIFLIDPAGELRALFSPPHIPEQIAADYRRVVAAGHEPR
jgi:protein SCO1/2